MIVLSTIRKWPKGNENNTNRQEYILKRIRHVLASALTKLCVVSE